MSKKKLYELTPKHRAAMPAWRDKWIANAMSTKAMDDADRDALAHQRCIQRRLCKPMSMETVMGCLT